MAESDKKAPKVVNKSGTLKMDDDTAATKQTRDMSGKKMDRKNRRDRNQKNASPLSAESALKGHRNRKRQHRFVKRHIVFLVVMRIDSAAKRIENRNLLIAAAEKPCNEKRGKR